MRSWFSLMLVALLVAGCGPGGDPAPAPGDGTPRNAAPPPKAQPKNPGAAA